jgi:hypothetical protein
MPSLDPEIRLAALEAVVGVETRNALRRHPKVRARASASAIGSPSPSTSPG